MNGPQLHAWRTAEDISLRELSDILKEVSPVTHVTLSRWENSDDEIPKWASDALLNQTKIELPLGELHQLLDIARRRNTEFPDLIATAIKEYLARQKAPATDYKTAAALGAAAMMLHETPPDITEADVDSSPNKGNYILDSPLDCAIIRT